MTKTTNTACKHNWLIDAPAGPTSMGRCKACGQTREFRNSFAEFTYWRGKTKKKPAAA